MGFEYKEKLKEMLPDYMELLEEQAKTENRGNNYWACPFCGSGDNVHHTAAFHINGIRYKCFSCNEGGDIFDLVGHIEKLPKGNFIKQYNRTLKIMRPYLDGGKPKKSREEYIPEFSISTAPEDYTEYLHKCHENVAKTDYFSNRGLSKKTVDRFNLGYDPEKNLVTIPYNPDCKGYVDRVLWDSNSKYYKHGNELFNVDTLYTYHTSDDIFFNIGYVFVTEGQFDAMSFMEIGLNAVGLGGTNEIMRLKKQLKEYSSNKILILALDNDKAGKRATGKFIEELAEDGINQRYIVISDLYKQYKDANEFLVADRYGFEERMKAIVNK